MSKPLPTAWNGQLTRATTRPFWCIEISFPSPLRFCNRQAMTISGDAFQHAGINTIPTAEQLELVNENQQFTDTFFNNDTAGVRVRIWRGYGVGAVWSYSDLLLEFDDQMGPLGIGAEIQIQLRRQTPLQTPRLTIGDVIPRAHLVADGAVIQTAAGPMEFTTR